jgi:hypothetical protein
MNEEDLENSSSVEVIKNGKKYLLKDMENSIIDFSSSEMFTWKSPVHIGFVAHDDYIARDKNVGDVFNNIHDATIINKSLVKKSFNKVKKEHDEETSKALAKVAEFIEISKDHAAGALFDTFNKELNKPQPDKTRLKSFWTGIQNTLPSIASISESVAKIVQLFD